jgi:Tfp pilus assembly PilM family ATPase
MPKWIEKTKSFLTAGPPPRFVALDMEGRRLRIVFAEPQRGLPVFRKLALVEAPEALDLKNAKAVGEFIGGALKELGLPLTRVLMDVPRSQSVLKTLTLPPVESERELPAMVRYQVEKELPFPLDQAVIDFTVDNHYVTDANAGTPGDAEAKKPDTIDVLVAAVQRSVVEHHEQVAAAGGFKLHRLGLRPYADMRCLDACLPKEERKLNILLVHVLPGEVEINLLIEGGLAFSRSAAIRQHDDEGRPFTPKETLDGYVMEIARSAQSALSSHRGRKIDRVFIAGDTGEEKAIVEIIGERFRTPCAALDPARALRLKTEGVDGRGFVTPLGLAIAHGTAESMPFDFLNPKNPPVERNIKKIRNIAAAASIGLILVVGLTWGLINRNAATSRLAALRDKYNDLDKKNRPVEKLAQRVKAVEEWRAESLNWLDHWANISAHFPPAGPNNDAYITAFRSNPDGSLSLNVKARASKVITDLSKALRESGYDVKLGAETVQNDDYGYRYVMAVRLAVDPKQKVDIAKLKVERRPYDDGSAEIIRSKGKYVPPPATPADSASQAGDDEEDPEIDVHPPAKTAGPEKTGSDAGTAEKSSASDSHSRDPRDTGKTADSSREPTDRTSDKTRTSGEKSSDNREKTDDKSKSSGAKSRDDRSRDRR